MRLMVCMCRGICAQTGAERRRITASDVESQKSENKEVDSTHSPTAAVAQRLVTAFFTLPFPTAVQPVQLYM